MSDKWTQQRTEWWKIQNFSSFCSLLRSFIALPLHFRVKVFLFVKHNSPESSTNKAQFGKFCKRLLIYPLFICSVQKKQFVKGLIYPFCLSKCFGRKPVGSPVQVSLTFLTSLANQGKSLNQIFMTRSALSSEINQDQNVRLGKISIVKRYMKGIFEKKTKLLEF